MGQNVIKSVSLPVDLAQFIDSHPEFSLSKFVQARLIEVRDSRVAYENKLKVYENKLQTLQRELYEANEEIDRLKKENENK